MRRTVLLIPLLLILFVLAIDQVNLILPSGFLGCRYLRGEDSSGLGLEVAAGYKAELLIKSNLASPCDIVLDQEGNLFIAQTNRDSIVKVTPNGYYEEYVKLPANAQTVVITPEDELLAGAMDWKIYKITKDKKITKFADVMTFRMTIDDHGNVYSVSLSSEIRRTTPQGQTSVFMGGFEIAADLDFDSRGNLYVADSGVGKVYKIVGNEKIAFAEGFNIHDPFHIAFDNQDTLYSTDNNYGVAKMEDGKMVSLYKPGETILGGIGELVIDEDNTIYVVSSANGILYKVTADGTIRILIPGWNSRGMAIRGGSIYVSDDTVYPPENGRILRINDGKTIATGFYKPRDIITDGSYFYLLEQDPVGGANLWRIDDDGNRSLFKTVEGDAVTLAYDPRTEEVLVFFGDSNRIVRIGKNGATRNQPVDFRSSVFSADMAVDKGGTLYVLATYTDNYNVGPNLRDLIIVRNGMQSTFNLDVDRPNSENDIAVNSKGEIFALLPDSYNSWGQFRLVRLEQGKVVTIVRNLPVDPLALDIDSSDTIYLNCAAGIIKVSKL